MNTSKLFTGRSYLSEDKIQLGADLCSGDARAVNHRAVRQSCTAPAPPGLRRRITTGTGGRTVTLKVKYANFHQITRSTTVAEPVATQVELEQLSCGHLEPVFPVQQGIRLLGVTLSALGGGTSQGDEQLRLSL
jgi:nucleotidyltransferase/DNA polymerase involved in DNA repair